jgi:hypothetical protein
VQAGERHAAPVIEHRDVSSQVVQVYSAFDVWEGIGGMEPKRRHPVGGGEGAPQTGRVQHELLHRRDGPNRFPLGAAWRADRPQQTSHLDETIPGTAISAVTGWGGRAFGCADFCFRSAIILRSRAIQYSPTGWSLLLARIIQTDAVVRGNESRRRISSELDFLVIVAVRRALHKNQFTPLGSSHDPPCKRMKLFHRRAASWSRPRSACE